MSSIDKIFRELISLVGKEVDVGLRSTGEKLRGTVTYTMFDSFLLLKHSKIIFRVIKNNLISYVRQRQ